MVAGPRRGDHLTALTDQDRCVTVLHRGTAIWVPQRLRIEVRMMIDEARGDDPPGGIDGPLGGGAVVSPDADNSSLMHRHVGLE